jgi:hypothetical protein
MTATEDAAMLYSAFSYIWKKLIIKKPNGLYNPQGEKDY